MTQPIILRYRVVKYDKIISEADMNCIISVFVVIALVLISFTTLNL